MPNLLKFLTCGSVDDGKSTLIGHLLYDAKLIFADQERALEMDSQVRSAEGALDYSLLLDGLLSEREQGITIDVAYRYFKTENRSFIVADCPGHEQYTRNMAVGASFAQLAVILIDARVGVTEQTLRHTRICSLMGIGHFVVAINKMDLIEFDRRRFRDIETEIKKHMGEFPVGSLQVIPVSATGGDNIVNPSLRMNWYKGLPLLPYLETIEVEEQQGDLGFYLPVQRVSRPNLDFRGYQGQIAQGSLSVGDEITALPGGEGATVTRILVGNEDRTQAAQGDPVTVLLSREIDISRGSVLHKGAPLEQAGMLTATVLWMDDQPLIKNRSYYLKCGTAVVPAEVIAIKHKTEMISGKSLATRTLLKNEIGEVDIALDHDIILSAFEGSKQLGRFILIDRMTNMTSCCGVILHSMRRAKNITWQEGGVTNERRAEMKAQNPVTLWFTGLSGAGKSTVAARLDALLAAGGFHTMMLDGDNLRHGLNKDLGFTETERVENIRRVAEVSRLFNDAGIIVLVSLISPFEADRENAKKIIGDRFAQVYISTPLEVCEQRDVKGLYKKARRGEIQEFTGISSPYEPPENPDIAIDTSLVSLDEGAQQLFAFLQARITPDA